MAMDESEANDAEPSVPDLPDPEAAEAKVRRREYQERCSRANALKDAEQWEQALAEYTACRGLYPTDTILLLAMARCQFGLGRHPEAIALAEEAAAYDPTDYHPWEYIGFLRYKSGDLEGAEAAYRRTIDVAPWHGGGYDGICCVLLARCIKSESEENVSLLEEAERHGSRAVSLDPTPPAFWENLAWTRERLGMRPQARNAWLAAAKRHHAISLETPAAAEKAAGALQHTGSRLGDLGDWGSAEWAFQQAVVLRPEDYRLLANLAYTRERRHRYQEAAQTYETALAVPNLPIEERPMLQGRAGIAWAKAKNLAAARSLLERSLSSDPKKALNLWWLGAVFHRSGDAETGAKFRADAIRQDPSLDDYLY